MKPNDTADLIDALIDRHGLSMVRVLDSVDGRKLMAIRRDSPHDTITIDGATTREVVDRLWDRVVPMPYSKRVR